MGFKMNGWSGYQNSPVKQTVKRRRKKHLRNLERNKSGRDATVLMEWGEGENEKGEKRYFTNPSITFKGDEPARDQSFDEALKAGEVYEFKNKRRAEKFAAGSWKKGKAKREAMKKYRQSKKEKRKEKIENLKTNVSRIFNPQKYK